MSQTRGLALFAVLMAFGSGVIVITPAIPAEPTEPAIDTAPVTTTWTLVEADSCTEMCTQQCGGECSTAYTVGCNCYWLCPNGEPGEELCTAPINVRICG